MRQIQVPFIADFEEVDLDTALELEGARFQVDQVNWPAAFPYAPLCAGRIARTEDALVVDFRVSGLDLRALNTEDNGSQWEDSCVKRPAEEMEEILRIARFEGPQEYAGGIWDWRVTVLIPFELVGADPENLPEKLRANFYKCGDKTAHPHFLSWNPVGTPSPDFHRPEFFGELILR